MTYARTVRTIRIMNIATWFGITMMVGGGLGLIALGWSMRGKK